MNHNTSGTEYEGDLAFFRKIAPVNGNHWAKRESLTVFEAVLLYCGIDPKGPHGVSEWGFEWQIRNLDEDGIYELIQDSFQRGSLEIRLGKIRVQDFCVWLQKKKFEVPECLRSCSQDTHLNPKKPIPLSTVPDVSQIDFSGLSPAVLAALGINIIAEICIRKTAKEPGKNLKISAVLQTKMAKELKAFCAELEGTDEKADSTLRKHIERRFKKE